MTQKAGPDSVDLRIIDAVRADPQVTNKEIAQKLGVSEPIVGSRIRQLSERNIMRVTAQLDIRAIGYDLMCLATIHIEGLPSSGIAAKIAEIDEVFSVNLCIGNADLFVNILAQDRHHLRRIIETKLSPIDGIELVDTHICLEIVKLRSDHGELSPGSPSLAAPPASIGDELTQNIIRELQIDGRVSNREMSRKLGVSEGTIRNRLKKLVDDKAMRLGAVTDPRLLGVGAVGFVLMAVRTRQTTRVIEELHRLEEVIFIGFMSGISNVAILAEAESLEHLSELCADKIRPMPGVLRMSTLSLARSHKHRYDLIRIK